MNQTRYLEPFLQTLCFDRNKMAFISGPRQCGKTTMAKHILAQRETGAYYNWDEISFRRLWTKKPSNILPTNEKQSSQMVIILDEIHKAKLWKRTLKGVYDTMTTPADIIVTGSARLNIYRKGSDSLLGRYYPFRLHPFSLAEMATRRIAVSPDNLLNELFNNKYPINKKTRTNFDLLQKFGPFPEPLFAASEQIVNLWQRNRIERLIREDLRDISRLPELSQVEMLASLLPERAANRTSMRSLSEDLEVAETTVKRWLNYLKELYYIFDIKPYSQSIPRSTKKEGKLYLWDWSEIESEGARFENLIASHLLKYCDYLTDTGRGTFELRYLRNKQKKEIDFLVLKNKKPWFPVEAKLSNEQPSSNWQIFMKNLPCQYAIQVTQKPKVFHIIEYPNYKLLLVSADTFLSYLI